MTLKEIEAARVLAHEPKRANELTRRELVSIVDQIQLFIWGDGAEGGKERWKYDGQTNGSDLIDVVVNLMEFRGLAVEEEFNGKPVRYLDLEGDCNGD